MSKASHDRCYYNTGPAIIGRNCRIGPGAYIRENVIVGDNCVVGNSVELKHCLLFNGCQVPHYNYIGESVLGYKAHLGAGAICSNWKLIPTAHVFVYVYYYFTTKGNPSSSFVTQR